VAEGANIPAALPLLASVFSEAVARTSLLLLETASQLSGEVAEEEAEVAEDAAEVVA